MASRQKRIALGKIKARERAARKKVMSYVHHVLGYSWYGLRFKEAIKLFADHFSLTIEGDIRDWLYKLYESGTNEIIRRHSRDVFYNTREWKLVRYEVLAHYGTECMKCGFNHPSNCVDHIKPRKKYPELAYDFDNMQVLCSICNLIKSDRDITDYRKIKKEPI